MGHVVGCGGMWEEWWQSVGACGRGWGYVVGGQAFVMDRDMWQGWGHVIGCGGIWQGVGACGRVWTHVAGALWILQGGGASLQNGVAFVKIF